VRRPDRAGTAPSGHAPRVPARRTAHQPDAGGDDAGATRLLLGGALSSVQLRVRLQPRAARSEMTGERDGALLVGVEGVDEAALRSALGLPATP